MLTNPAFEPHFSRSSWEHQEAVRPEVAFLSCTIAGATLSFAEVAVGETHKVRFVEHHAIEAQHRGGPASEAASAGSRNWPHVRSTRQPENLAFSLESPDQGRKAGT